MRAARAWRDADHPVKKTLEAHSVESIDVSNYGSMSGLCRSCSVALHEHHYASSGLFL